MMSKSCESLGCSIIVRRLRRLPSIEGELSHWFARFARSLALLDLLDLLDAGDVAAALQVGGEPDQQDLVRQPEADDPAAHRQHDRRVVEERGLGRVEGVAHDGADALYRVRV